MTSTFAIPFGRAPGEYPRLPEITGQETLTLLYNNFQYVLSLGDLTEFLAETAGTEGAAPVAQALVQHKADHTNPHGVTAAQIGLSPTSPGLPAFFQSLFLAWAASLPVWNGTGAAPVATGQPYMNNGTIQIAQ
jgi:hypothetical protein